MEEDIMILESECYYLEDLGYLRDNNHYIRFNQALENLIKGYRELEGNKELKTIKGFEENIEVSKFGEWVGKNYIDYKFEYENYQRILADYIPKSKIKEKLEELETKLKVFEKDIRYCKDRVQARLMNDEIYVLRRCMDLLKELMEE